MHWVCEPIFNFMKPLSRAAENFISAQRFTRDVKHSRRARARLHTSPANLFEERTMRTYLCALLVLMLCACVSKPAEERAGEWLAGGWLMQTGQPGAKPRLLVFEHQGVVWTGTITTAVREVELKDIAVNGEQVSYSQAFNPGAGRSITTQGVLKNGELHLTMNSPTGVTEQTAQKISNEQVAAFEAARPKKVSLQPLH